MDGKLTFYDQHTGRRPWEFQLPDKIKETINFLAKNEMTMAEARSRLEESLKGEKGLPGRLELIFPDSKSGHIDLSYAYKNEQDYLCLIYYMPAPKKAETNPKSSSQA